MSYQKQDVYSIINKNKIAILDGGLGTELQLRGYNVENVLWSASLLKQAPDAIYKTHLDYLEAGADIITSASYQASIDGYITSGFCKTSEEALDLIKSSVKLALKARDEFWQEKKNKRLQAQTETEEGLTVEESTEELTESKIVENGSSHPHSSTVLSHPLVAASVGSYGAFLANGSEYSGDYGPDVEESTLFNFHEARFWALVDCKPDILAIETLPSSLELKVLISLINKLADVTTSLPFIWVSFSIGPDAHSLTDGTPLEEAIELVKSCPSINGVGANCISIENGTKILSILNKHTSLPLVLYPNDGEIFDTTVRRWKTGLTKVNLASSWKEWYAHGARIIGGCCRTRPHDIAELRRSLTSSLHNE